MTLQQQKSLNGLINQFPLLKRDIMSVENLRNELANYFCGTSFKIRFIARNTWLHRFYSGNTNQRISTVFHGTNNRNDSSILQRGLIVGGTKGVAIAHGSSYGAGIYCSPLLNTASQYAIGSIYVCLVRGARENGHIWIAPDEAHILPCFFDLISSCNI